MANLPLEVTHSLSFLTNTLHDIKNICNSTSDVANSLYTMDIKKDGAPGQMRKKSSKHREDMDDDIEFIMDDFNLFQKEMNDIVRNKDDETVIYSLRQYKKLYDDYKDIKKDLSKINDKTNTKTSKCIKDKDYVRYIAINKISVPLYKLTQVVDACIYALEHLLDNDDKKKEV